MGTLERQVSQRSGPLAPAAPVLFPSCTGFSSPLGRLCFLLSGPGCSCRTPLFHAAFEAVLTPGDRLPVLAFLIPKGLLLKVVSAMAGGVRVVGERVEEHM